MSELDAKREELFKSAHIWNSNQTDRDLQRALCDAASAYAAARAGRGSQGGSGGDTAVFPNYGRSRGLPIKGAKRGDLEFYLTGCRRTLADPEKARFHDKERLLMAAIEAELAGAIG